MEQRNNKQDLIIFEIENLLNKMSNQVNFLIRKEMTMNQLDVDLLMENTRKLYDTICSIELGIENSSDVIPVASDELGIDEPEEFEAEEEMDFEEESEVEEGFEEPEVEEEMDFEEESEVEEEFEEPEAEEEIEFEEESEVEEEFEEPEAEEEIEFEEESEVEEEFEESEAEEEIEFEEESEIVEENTESVEEHKESADMIWDFTIEDKDTDSELMDSSTDRLIDSATDSFPTSNLVPENDVDEDKKDIVPSPITNIYSAQSEEDSGIRTYKIVRENAPTLGDVLEQVEDNSLAARLQRKPVADLISAIGINDKFLFLNELFGGSMEKYNKSIRLLNSFSTLLGAKTYMSELQIEFQWDCNSDAYKKLADLVERRFISIHNA
ncbi:MAG: hypothetical protein IIW55_06110 [Bacteroidales bacterium]|nr:hypothetical protein [Bacteroidales bacterium]